MPKVFIAADHTGIALKETLFTYIKEELGLEVEDRGAFGVDSADDYPDIVVPCAQDVAHTPGARGIIIGGSGQGEAMAANRIKGVRAAVFYGPIAATGVIEAEGAASEDRFDIVRLARRHNDANILSLGARFVSEHDAQEAVRIFLATSFSDEERHRRRIEKF